MNKIDVWITARAHTVKFRAYIKSIRKILPVIDISFDVDGLISDIQVAGCGNAGCRTCNDYYESDDFIIMQYTGLKDANGTDIYEGDVIGREKDDSELRVSHHVVGWYDTGFMGKQICSYGSLIGLEYWTQGENSYVVIGNVYEKEGE
ncbi:YopX family protein [Bacillus sp. Hm123]|uniref:YopX family protein n=1 Tax=Bacillus sp. Hm123 TaxID=3450745 RepID=UPI003F436E2A